MAGFSFSNSPSCFQSMNIEESLLSLFWHRGFMHSNIQKLPTLVTSSTLLLYQRTSKSGSEREWISYSWINSSQIYFSYITFHSCLIDTNPRKGSIIRIYPKESGKVFSLQHNPTYLSVRHRGKFYLNICGGKWKSKKAKTLKM